MAESTVNVDRLPPAMRQPARGYAELVREAAGPKALALALYGMVLGGSFDPRSHSARSVLVLERVDLDLLRRVGDRGVQLGKAGFAAPVVMTPEHIADSLDTFPLELMEIQQQHILLFGKDYFGELTFQPEHVRLQCERELKSAMILMHHGLLTAGAREPLLHPLALDAAEGLARILRGILWLKGIREPRSTAQTVSEVEKVVNRQLPGIGLALDASRVHGWNTFRLLYDDIAALGSMVDGW